MNLFIEIIELGIVCKIQINQNLDMLTYYMVEAIEILNLINDFMDIKW